MTRWRLEDPFVVPAPSGATVRTKVHAFGDDASVLRQVSEFLGSYFRQDLAARCKLGLEHADRNERKKELTPAVSSRWANPITLGVGD